VEDQDLAVAVRTGADADGGHRHRLGDRPGDLGGDGLEHDGEAAGVGQRSGVVDERLGGIELLSLHPVAPERVHRLGGEPEVAHDGDLGVEQRLDHREPATASLQLHRLGAHPYEGGGVGHRVGRAQVVGEPGKVGHDERAGAGPCHRGDVVRHLGDRHGEGVVVAEDDHGHRVADEDHVDAGLVEDPGAREVVGRHHHDRWSALARPHRRGGELLAHAASSRPTPRWLPAVGQPYR
jgi:hypothetical protein